MNNEQQDEIEKLGLIEIIPCEVEEKRDEKGRVIWIKYYDGTTSEFIYDEKDRVILEKFPDGETEDRKYTDNGKIILHRYPEDATEEWKFNVHDKLIFQRHSNGTTEEWKYDERGNLIWHRDTKEIYYIDDKEYRKAEPLKTSLDKVREKFKDISGGLDIGSCSLNDIEDKNIHNQKVLGYLIGLREGYQKTH